MSAQTIVSYDGTPNDDDALILGAALSRGGDSLALAYVRHSREIDPRREELAQHDAERRLRSGIDLLGDPGVTAHVLFSGSTNEGLGQFAAAEGARLLVFASDYRTAPGRAEPGNTAQRLLDGGPFAVAVARAGLRVAADEPLATVAAANPQDDPAVEATVESLVGRLGLIQVEPNAGAVDLIVVGSQRGVPAGTLALSGSARSALNTARGSVLVLARERPLTL
jgi:nucleotide-binding universal stress UspA family protein